MKTYNFKTIDEKLSFKKYSELNFYGLPEVCFTGRSNVGKSSLINALTNTKNTASISNKPGHTKKISFIIIDKKLILVDLPGYGYAKVSKKKTREMSELLFLYLTKRTFLKKVFILIDSRHGFKENDLRFLEFLNEESIPFQVLFTKSDKITKKQKSLIENNFNFHALVKKSDPLFTSAKKKIGIKKIKSKIIESI